MNQSEKFYFSFKDNDNIDNHNSYISQSITEVKDFNEYTNIFHIVNQIKFTLKNIEQYDSSSSLMNINKAIFSLRILLKYQRRIFVSLFNDIIDYFISLLYSSINSLIYNQVILQNCLYLVKEIIVSYANENVYNEWIPLILERVISLSVNEKDQEIQKLSDCCIHYLIKYCDNIEDFPQFIIDLCDNEDEKVALKAGCLFGNLLSKGRDYRKGINFQNVINKIFALKNSGYKEYDTIGNQMINDVNILEYDERVIYGVSIDKLKGLN